MDPRLPRRILVGLSFPDDPAEVVDVSANDLTLVEQAVWYAGRVEGEIELVHVIEGPDEALPHHTITLHDALRDLVRPRLETITEEIRARGVPAQWRFEEGRAWHRLILAAKECDAGLVMVSPRREREPLLDRIVHGSTTRRLLRKCPTPVWVVEPDQPVGIRKILVPVDFSEVSRPAVELAEGLHGISNAERHLLHCVLYPSDIQLRRHPDGAERVLEYHQAVQKAARREIDKLLDGHDGWEAHLAEGDVVSVVHEAVVEQDFDHLVMGSVARSGLVGWLMGNAAEKILNRHEASAWVLKPPGWVPIV